MLLDAVVCGPGELVVDLSLHQQQIRQSVPSKAHALEPPSLEELGGGLWLEGRMVRPSHYLGRQRQG